MDEGTKMNIEISNPIRGEFCPLHEMIQKDITDIKGRQEGRPCQTHTAEITALGKSEKRLEDDNRDQWTAINRLRAMVYMGAGATGILAFLGSILGTYLKGK